MMHNAQRDAILMLHLEEALLFGCTLSRGQYNYTTEYHHIVMIR